jgi:polysaccharide deacetylase family protein (PEP-CTERM system associated)
MVIPPGGSLPISRAGSPPVAAAEISNRKQETQNMPRTPIINALTINVEDYFQVSAFARYIARSEWDGCASRVERNVERILDMLYEFRVKATFFMSGWIAERHPWLVRRIADSGHELASHGYGHWRVSELDENAFFADIDAAKKLLENFSGKPVKGYRAPSFSIGEKTPWAFDCLQRAGYRYSSSVHVHPICQDHYGMPNASRFAHQVRDGLLEIPPTGSRFFARNWPGSGYFRLMPYAVSRCLLERVNRRDAQPAIFYFHPWEIDHEQPRIPGIDLKTRFRHYFNLQRTEGRLRRLLGDFHWGRMDAIFLPPSGGEAG